MDSELSTWRVKHRITRAPQQPLHKWFYYLSCCRLLHPESQISFNQKQYSMNTMRIHVLQKNRGEIPSPVHPGCCGESTVPALRKRLQFQRNLILQRYLEAWQADTRNREGCSAEHQGLKVVHFTSTNLAVLKEAMKEVRSWLP